MGAAAVVGSGTVVAFAQDSQTTTDVSVSADDAGLTRSIEPGDTADDGPFSGVFPGWSPIIDAVGQLPDADHGNKRGTLFLIDTGDYQGDLRLTLYYDNPVMLAAGYSYFRNEIGVRTSSEDGLTYDDGGTETDGWDGDAYKDRTGEITEDDNPDDSAHLTIENGFVVLHASNDDRIAVTVESGSFYAVDDTADNLSPQFFLEVRQA